jgi:hypothetical protein
MRETGIASSTLFNTFWPEPRTFEGIIGVEIERMISSLELDADKLDYTDASIRYIERMMHKKNFIHRQQVLRLYLGILSYAGEYLIRKYDGKWYLEIEEEERFSSWKPMIQLRSGEILDPFVGLLDGLQLRAEGRLIPIISLRA